MATDNTQLNQGADGDLIRDIARQSGPVKTQVIQIDAGGAAANAEVLITAGAQPSAKSLPVVLATDQPPIPVAFSSSAPIPVTGTFWQTTQPVSGAFWQTTQPVSLASAPLATNAAQETGGNLDKIASAVTAGLVQANLSQVGGVGAASGAGVANPGSQRVAIAQDTTTIAGAAPGTAGSPSANVISMQGVPGGSPMPISGVVSASFGGFIPANNYVSATVANGSSVPTALGTIAPGQTVIVYNTGSTPVGVVFGASPTATATQGDVIQGASWQAFTVPTGANHIATWGFGGTTSVLLSAGTGLPIGAGGGGSGGGGGGGGTVTQGPQGTAGSAWFVSPGTGATWILGAGSSLIGSVAQSGTWTVSWTGQTVAATQSGNWSARIQGAAGTTLDSAAGTANGQAVTVQGNNSGVAMPTARIGYAAQNTTRAAMTATVAQIVAARTGVPGTGRGKVMFFNVGNGACDIGASGVASGSGYPLSPGQTTPWFDSTAAWFGICPSGVTTSIAFVELF